MIKKITASDGNFKKVEFNSDFNLIVANKSETSDEKDSRNGLGKTSLIEIIHFCFGAEYSKTKVLKKEELLGWEFTLDFNIQDINLSVTRVTSNPGQIIVSGDIDSLPTKPAFNKENGYYYYSKDNWNKLLGEMLFNISDDEDKYKPTFRSLFPFFARKGLEAYTDPFSYFKNPKSYQTKILNAFLLGMSWEYSRDWQILKDREESINGLKKASKGGFLGSLLGSIGQLEAEKTRLEKQAAARLSELRSFQVHLQYAEIEKQADRLTIDLHKLSNENISDRQLLEYYQASVRDEKTAAIDDLEKVYSQVSVIFPDQVKKRLDDVRAFHSKVIENRKGFLQEEVVRLEKEIDDRNIKIKNISDTRAESMRILDTHKALESYNYLQQEHTKVVSEVERINRRIEELKQFEEEQDNIKIDKSSLQKIARKDYEERKIIREEAISLFNSHSEYLYETPGNLIIDTDDGYKFKIEIQRSESDGFGKMKTLCYDLTFAKLLAKRNLGPGFLIHDSSIFADVDERQVAKALQLAAKSAREYKFQYIAFLNSWSIPAQEYFEDDFNIHDYKVLELKDHPEGECLFGFRF